MLDTLDNHPPVPAKRLTAFISLETGLRVRAFTNSYFVPSCSVHRTSRRAFAALIQPQPINEVTPGTRHLGIKNATRLIHHNRPSNNALAASYKLTKASSASWDALKDELFESRVCSMPDRVESVVNAKWGTRGSEWGVTSFIGYDCMSIHGGAWLRFCVMVAGRVHCLEMVHPHPAYWALAR